MEIERLGENKIRCALSEEEIREMGYNIDEIYWKYRGDAGVYACGGGTGRGAGQYQYAEIFHR